MSRRRSGLPKTPFRRSSTPKRSTRSIPAIRALYPYDSIEDFGKKAGFFAFPPTEADGKLATFSDWLKAYERFKTA